MPRQTIPVGSGLAVLQEGIALNGAVMWISSGAPGTVLVVVRGPDTVIQGYGETSKGNGSEPEGKSLLRLGSITKVFAGEVLGALVNSGKVRLTDALTLYAQGAPVPSFGERQITLLDLATHSAGCRVMPARSLLPVRGQLLPGQHERNSGTGSPNTH